MTLVLAGIFGTLGYLVIGWAATVVCAAALPTKTHDGTPRASVAWWWNLAAWPLVLPGLGVGWLLINGGEWLSDRSLRLVKRINPKIGGRWY